MDPQSERQFVENYFKLKKAKNDFISQNKLRSVELECILALGANRAIAIDDPKQNQRLVVRTTSELGTDIMSETNANIGINELSKKGHVRILSHREYQSPNRHKNVRFYQLTESGAKIYHEAVEYLSNPPKQDYSGIGVD